MGKGRRGCSTDPLLFSSNASKSYPGKEKDDDASAAQILLIYIEYPSISFHPSVFVSNVFQYTAIFSSRYFLSIYVSKIEEERKSTRLRPRRNLSCVESELIDTGVEASPPAVGSPAISFNITTTVTADNEAGAGGGGTCHIVAAGAGAANVE